MDLSGTWRALVADEDLRRNWLDPDEAARDETWEPVAVPGHWRSHTAFADADGPLLYRTTFDQPAPAPGERWWLRFDGLFYQGDVWLDGSYVGDTEGYFFPHSFEVTEALAAQREHVLGVEVACAPQRDRTHKRNITGVFQHWDCLDPDWNPGGIWRPVGLEATGSIRIQHLRVICRRADPTRADVAVRAVLDAAEAGGASIRTTVGGTEHIQEVTVAGGENQLEWTVAVAQPRLWWPWALGDQPLEDVTVEVTVDGADRPSHTRRLRTGLRQIAMRNWIMSINGERMFVKGSNHGPTRMALGEATPEEIRRDVDLAVDCGLDLLRVHAHVTRPELYDAADEAGLLLWQDMPLQWGYARGIRKQAVRQAREAVDLLGHHPSVAVWCGHNEPFALDVGPGAEADPGAVGGRLALAQELPTWNKTVLDRSVKRAIEKSDASRPVIAHSGVLPHPPTLDGTDSHLYFGWYHGDERDLPDLARRLPRLVRWVGEFGAQAVPETASFMDPDRWPDLDWERLGHTHALQKRRFDEHVPPAEHATFASWQASTQAYQATVVKHHVETLRRLKYRPTGGFAHFCFADGHPAVTWSVLDHERVPKAGFEALREACRPVIVVADRLPATVAPGDALALDVHVVSDLRVAIEGATVRAELAWTGDSETWTWAGDVGADECRRVGTLQVVVPDAPGPLSLSLALDAGEQSTTNHYDTSVI
jgi:beta-mannosidase